MSDRALAVGHALEEGHSERVLVGLTGTIPPRATGPPYGPPNQTPAWKQDRRRCQAGGGLLTAPEWRASG
eukprot:15462477-Alexandrium_andersonii.AAC.1